MLTVDTLTPSLDRVVEALPLPAWICDVDGTTVVRNGLAGELFGASGLPAELSRVGRCSAEDDALPPGDQRVTLPGGSRWLHFERRALRGADGSVRAVLVTVEDRTELQELREAIAASELRRDRERRLFELAGRTATVAAAEIELPTRRLRWTAGSLRTLGFPPDEALCLDGLCARFDDESRLQLEAALARLGEEDGETALELRMRRGDGRPTWMRLVARSTHDGDGARIDLAIRDIDRRRTEEQALGRLAEVLAAGRHESWPRVLVRALAESFRVDGAFVAELLPGPGHRLELVAGWRDGLDHPTVSWPATSSPCGEALERPGVQIVAGAGRRYPLDPVLAGHEGWIGVALCREDGTSLGVLGLISRRPFEAIGPLQATLSLLAGRLVAELTAAAARNRLGAAEEQLRRTRRLESVATLAGGVAHDFNNLLTVLISHAALAREELGQGHPVSGELAAIEEVAMTAAGLTGQLLAFSRPRPIDVSTLEPAEVVRGMEGVLRPLVAGRVELELTPTAGLGRVLADRAQLEQIVLNLVLNARDASPLGGRVRVETFGGHLDSAEAGELGAMRPGAWLALSVSDRGEGVPTDLAERIFEPFFTTKAPGRGTGLGLATVREIALRLGGHVAMAGRVGGGSVFTVYLPRVEERAGPPTLPVQSRTWKQAPSRRPRHSSDSIRSRSPGLTGSASSTPT